jgi:hypothetical protein
VTLPDNPVTVPPIVIIERSEVESSHPLTPSAMAAQAMNDCNTRELVFIGAPFEKARSCCNVPAVAATRSTQQWLESRAGIVGACSAGKRDAPRPLPRCRPFNAPLSRRLI